MKEKISRILLIDDDDLTNQIHETVISVWSGGKAFTKVFADATKALEYLKSSLPEELPNLILLDLNMPGMNGWDFMRKFKELNLSLPICVLSSSILKSDKENALKQSFVASFISKPLKPAHLDQLTTIL
ncbi:MAG: response regulator [Bacteroidia bacterium]|nr:response regulator [Bacteroidia bacterium]